MTGDTARPGRAASPEAAQHPRSKAKRLALAIFAVLAFAVFAALGTWQVVRLQWKLALIERVEERVHAAPVAAPGPERWAQISAESDEYRQVRLAGSYRYEKTVRVQAVTDLGAGYWLMTPLVTNQGSIVLVNRGFVPAGQGDAGFGPARPGSGAAEVSGLLRMSQPGGAFLRRNDPAAGRWYSRDVGAIAAAQGLGSVAPYFIDADAASAERDARQAPGPAPVGGLTVVSFHNNHLVYALTWYALALMVAGAFYWVARQERRRATPDREEADGSNN
ncbi:SURF1 family protein [Noviherbaspirillum soli]|uniref:SURF1 family protein n=1 Tax=Noviherbaspirillum soli TaxID=1064518 RepID=UPI00188D4836|nr:SURF1 family protein [Noviherbaspirillum soli]